MAEIEMNDTIQQHPQPQEDAPPPQEDGPPPQTKAPPPQENATLPQENGMPPQEDGPPPQVAAPPLPRLPRYPNQYLLGNDRRRDFIRMCVPLYNALMIGDWGAAHGFLDEHENLKRSSITDNLETALHVVASAQNNMERVDHFVQILVNMMEPADLLLENKNGNTALSLAATSGNVSIARIMVKRNTELLTIANNHGMLPLYIAVLHRNLEMIHFLYDKSDKMRGGGWTDNNRSWVFEKAIEAELFDMAREILEFHPLVAKRRGALYALARNPYAFNEIEPNFFRKFVNSIFCLEVDPVAMETKAVKLLGEIWTRIDEYPKADIDNILRGPMVMKDGYPTYPSRILFVAAEMGNTKFLAKLILRYPDLIWKTNDDGLSIFHVAVCHLHENIYNLLYEIGPMKALIIPLKDKENNNMLHLVGKKPQKSQLQGVSGVAFQMQRKLQWFKEVESIIPPSYRDRKNSSQLTPLQLFTENHKDLVSEAEKWMKGTASKCMVVAALIATVVFAVAYTIPGGYEQTTEKKKGGFPVFLHNAPFLVFVMLDAISLILSSISILVFLSILTSRYAQEDFLETLPRYLMVGLVLLFFSIVSMMISFSVSFYVIYRSKFIAIAIVITVGALIPIATYAKLQYPLLKDVFRSSYGSSYLFKPMKQMLYYQNPRV